jgi:hypothetical protein
MTQHFFESGENSFGTGGRQMTVLKSVATTVLLMEKFVNLLEISVINYLYD